MKITTNAKSLLKQLIVAILVLLFANIISLVVQSQTSSPYLTGLAKLFDFNEEANITTLFSTLILIGCSILLYTIFKRSRRNQDNFQKHWFILSVAFAFVAIDEFCGLHERLIPIISDAYSLPSYLKYSWVLPYGGAVLIGISYVIPFIKNLPAKISSLFVLSAFLYLGGAVGMELIGGNHHEIYGNETVLYATYYTLEELLEMIGSTLFLFSLIQCYNLPEISASSSTKSKNINQEENFINCSHLELD